MASEFKVDKVSAAGATSDATIESPGGDVVLSAPNGRVKNLNPEAGIIVNTTLIQDSSRRTLSTSGTVTHIQGNFTKKYDSSLIIATCTVFGTGDHSGECSVGLVLDGSNWNYGIGYEYPGSSYTYLVTVHGICQWSGISAGAHTMGWGWNPANGSTSERPFDILNPNQTDDSRQNQYVSSILIQEVAQ